MATSFRPRSWSKSSLAEGCIAKQRRADRTQECCSAGDGSSLPSVTTVYAPASTANLGPGFDVLGLALNRYVWVADGERETEGVPCGPDHIARIAYEAAGGTDPIWFGFDFPPSRGLGFSAAARAAGAVMAYVQQGLPIEEAQVAGYMVVADLEGHGDNAAPAVFGGLHVIAGSLNHRMSLTMPGQLLFWVPHHSTTSTDACRAVMPRKIDRADAVFNLGRMGLLISALYEGDLSLLARATQDRLHQPDRLDTAPDTKLALEFALKAGASAAWLSGSGPTVAIIVEPDKVAAIAKALPSRGDILELEVDQTGAVIR